MILHGLRVKKIYHSLRRQSAPSPFNTPLCTDCVVMRWTESLEFTWGVDFDALVLGSDQTDVSKHHSAVFFDFFSDGLIDTVIGINQKSGI